MQWLVFHRLNDINMRLFFLFVFIQHAFPNVFFSFQTYACFTFSATVEIQVRAEVGGNVSIYCPVNPRWKIKYFYLQKLVDGFPPQVFVNGFHLERNMSSISKWNNTRLDPHNKTTVHMDNVTLKHAGVYKCHFDEIDSATIVNLEVTGKRKTVFKP